MNDEGNTRDEFAPEDQMSIDEMPDVHDDETLREIVAALGALPVVSEADVQRIVSRAAAETAETGRRGTHRWALSRPPRESRDASAPRAPAARPRWFAAMPMAAAAALVLAAGVGGFLLRGATAGSGAEAVAVAPAPALPGDMTLTPVADAANAERPIMTQFVFDAPGAEQVSVVGAFNGWDAGATPLARDAVTGLWTVTLPLAPGRHVYAYMVDSVLTLDPRAPSTQDPELGTSGSVILVGTP